MRSLEKTFLQHLVCELEMDPVEIRASSADELLDHVLTYGRWEVGVSASLGL